MTARIFIFKVGPFEAGDSIYVPIGEDNGVPTDLDPVNADDDLSGVRGIVAQRRHEVLVCETALSSAASECGLEVEDLPAIYEGARVELAMQFAQGDALDNVTSSWAYLRIMSSLADLLERDILARWPVRQAFDVELRGDRSRTFSGWLGSDRSVFLVDSAQDAKSLALSSLEERTERLASLDHLSMRLETPPPYALIPIRDFYGIQVMPRFERRTGGALIPVDDEDVFVMAGVVAALANFTAIDLLCWADTSTPDRDVRTYVSAGLPFPLIEL
jgi:hypothetical protein